jgi:hypothetical protein
VSDTLSQASADRLADKAVCDAVANRIPVNTVTEAVADAVNDLILDKTVTDVVADRISDNVVAR